MIKSLKVEQLNIRIPLLFRFALLLLLDIIAIVVASFLCITIGSGCTIKQLSELILNTNIILGFVNILITVSIFYFFKLYSCVWKYASDVEFLNVILSVVICTFVKSFLYSLSFLSSFLYGVIFLLITCGIRFSNRLFYLLKENRIKTTKNITCMVVGAGDTGYSIIKEIESSKTLNMKVACAIDDNPKLHGKYLRGVPIVGDRNTILENVEKYSIDEIIISMPSVASVQIKSILDICKESGCKLKMLPGIYQILNGEVNVSKIREVQIEDLLGRDSINIVTEEIMSYVNGKVILVTGGGGSIGSELCRQLASHSPKQLIIFDIYENSTYDIQQELKHNYPELNLVVLIGSVRNTDRVNQVFREYRPDIVYHAAAHKHVPLMETSPKEAIKNNVFGTLKVAAAADKYGTSKFVLISTDKAVNPTNIMGASKRICEMIIQDFNTKSKTEFVAVRFGNVLGSNGSVIPLFKKQIQSGGPVTVTSPDVIRYFMTIPEAVSLVLQAGAYAKGGEIFILDMGEPVKILDLAKNLIKLSGYKVDEDIKIKFVGLRPGEKLYEELLMEEEGLRETANKLIHIGKPIEFNKNNFEQQLEELRLAVLSDNNDVREVVKKIVSTYQYA